MERAHMEELPILLAGMAGEHRIVSTTQRADPNRVPYFRILGGTESHFHGGYPTNPLEPIISVPRSSITGGCEVDVLRTRDTQLVPRPNSAMVPGRSSKQKRPRAPANPPDGVPCPDCGKRFKWKGSLTRHRQIHTGYKPHKCRVCGKSFTQAGTLQRHLRIHTGEAPYQCTHCQRRFRTNSNLRQHLRQHFDGTQHCRATEPLASGALDEMP